MMRRLHHALIQTTAYWTKRTFDGTTGTDGAANCSDVLVHENAATIAEMPNKLRQRMRRLVQILSPLLVRLPSRIADVPILAPFRSTILRSMNLALATCPQELTVRSRAGFTMTGSTADMLLRCIGFFGTWEPNITAWVSGFLHPGDVVIDVGANVGYFSLLSWYGVGSQGHVYAVEPVPDVVRVLKQNLRLNGASNVHILPMAASDAGGEIAIYSDSSNMLLSSTIPFHGANEKVVVPRARVADQISPDLWERVRLVKVDVEGEEIAALRGLKPIMDRMPIGSAVIVEVAPNRLAERGSTARQLQSALAASGFTEMHVVENSYDFRDLAKKVVKCPTRIDMLPEKMADVIFTKGR